ncbi:acetyl xylan esterase [Coprinopsis marcescibilis]|uniref:Carboxylic ester hydrolase n=1 Tax=Coprinopsis marcescibilis TaxID=230819 RepID=A0A5C3KXF0_COPMA|nr:acetyl xylan esterase [Coprinopsis marcescibilis]
MFRSLLLKIVTVSLLSTIGALAAINQLTQISGFGTNPTNVRMYLYRPPNLVANPALIVAMHYCTGTAQAYFTGTQYANRADTYKNFIVLYPHAPDSGGCWDVHTNATFTHNAGGDSLGIASAVRYAIQTYGVDPARVFATGTSSGAMMTNVLAGAYPDLFAAASAFAGVPYACFAGAGMWSNACAGGTLTKTAQQWGDLVRSGYPGYTGPRPRIQIFHGTADTTLSYRNHAEGIKQWTNVFGYSETAAQTQQNSPVSGWTRSIYGPNFQSISAANTPHNIAVQENDVLQWFGLITGPNNPVATTSVPPIVSTTSSSAPVVTPTLPPPTNCASKFAQCGGSGWGGATCCVSGSSCVVMNNWYSQCQ